MNRSSSGHLLTQSDITASNLGVPTNDHLKALSRSASVISRIPEKEREAGNGYGSISRLSSVHIQTKSKKSAHSMPAGSPLNLSSACGAPTPPAKQTPEQPQAVNHCSFWPDHPDPIGAKIKDLQPLPTTPHLRNDIFPADAPKPMVRSATPADHRGRIESTQQLAFCASLMPKDPLLPIVESGTTEVSVSNDAERTWLSAMQENLLARAHIRWLLSQLVAEFVKISSPESSVISEIVILGPALCRADYRILVSFFIERFEQTPLLNIDLLGGMVQVVQSASPGFLEDDDLIRILESLHQRLELADTPSMGYVYPLVFAVAKVLEVMVTHEVKGLDRDRDHQSLLAALRGLKGVKDDEALKFQVNYAHQTLLHLPDDETSWQAFLRCAESVAVGVPAAACIFKLDPTNALAAVEQLQQVAGNAADGVGFNIEAAYPLQGPAVGAAEAEESVSWSNKKESWFLTLQSAYAFVREGRLVDFNKLVCDAGCRFDANFQLGICQILGEIAADQLWDVANRRRAIDFLEEIYNVEAGRKKDFKIQKRVGSILRRISGMSWPFVSEHANALLTNLKEDLAVNIEDLHPLHFYLPLPKSSPLLGRVLNIPDVEHDVEHDLACIESRSLKKSHFPFSIPPRAKATLLASDDDSFPLMEKVHEFLKSSRQVFLLLGDSGSGKSTFCRQLERELWDNYKVGSRIPLLIDLPTIKKPDSNLIKKFLQDHNIEERRIQEIKRHRQLLLICDGYDESQLTANLYTTNQLSMLKEVKMIISCRNTFLSRVSENRFHPIESDKYVNHAMSSSLFEEATITPFTEDDIRDFITRYVMDGMAAESFGCVSVSSQDEYLRWLRAIPDVMDLAKNPFLLILALKAVSSLSGDALDNTNLEAIRLYLYDHFAKEWFQVSEKRIAQARLSPKARRAYDRLHEEDFRECARDYSIRLATAMYVKNGGCAFVEYTHRDDNQSWKAAFFGEDHKTTLLREASPLSRVGTQYRFIHQSLLDYFASLEIFDFCVSDGGDTGDSSRDDCHGDEITLSGGSGNTSGGSGSSSGGNMDSSGDNHSSTSGNGSTFERTDSSGEGTGGSQGDRDGPQPRNDDICSKRNGLSDASHASTSSELLTKLNLFKTPSVLQFLVEHARSNPRFKKHMLLVIKQSNLLTNSDLAGANAITILFKSGERFLNIDLDGVQVPFNYTLKETAGSTMLVTPWTGSELLDVLLASEAEPLSYSQATPTATLTPPTPLSNETQSTQTPTPCSDHPLEQLGPQALGSDSPNSTVRIRKRDKLHELLGTSKSISKFKSISTSKGVKSMTTKQLTRPSSIASQVSNELSGNNQTVTSPPAIQEANPRSSLQPSPPNMASIVIAIFPDNVSKPVIKIKLPRLHERIESTEQLVYCTSLLLPDSMPPAAVSGYDTATDAALCLQESTLDKAELDWLEEIKKDPMEQDHFHWLLTQMVEAFVADTTKDSDELAEIVTLGPVLQKEPYRKLLSSLIKDFGDARILDVNLLQALVEFVQSASPDYLVSDDLVKILSILRTCLQGIHHQSVEHSCHLALAVSKVLDVMADHKVQDLNRVLEHEPLSGVLSGLKGSSDPYLMYQACYAFQALQYVSDNESALQSVLRHSIGMVDDLAKVSAVFKLDLVSVLEGLDRLQESLAGAVGVATTLYEGVSSLMESGQGILNSLKEGLSSGQKRLWYPAIKAACAFAQAGQLKDLRQLIFEAPCRRDPLFQWGICQLLGEIAINPVWDIATRKQAIVLLGHLFKIDRDWGRDESIKAWILSIVTKLGANADHAVNTVAHSLLQDLKQGQCTSIQHAYPLTARLRIPTSSPILTKVHNIPSVEYDLHRLRLQRLKDAHQPVYIPLMAKANLRAGVDDLFPLMDKIQEFLASDRLVMLILGDSLSGKSTFNKHLELVLLQSYTCGGHIPLFINLPAIYKPEEDMVAKHLRNLNFTDAQIQGMKQHRQFILICDGYDESQLTINLHSANRLNRPVQWKSKMIISCRTQYLGPAYLDRFMPESNDRYSSNQQDLFEEAVIAPFSKGQVRHYVEQYVSLEPRTWTIQDYMEKLTTIPNLIDLVRSPFLLSISLEVLPQITKGNSDLSTIKISRVQLYDTFVDHWLDVNKRRLQGKVLPKENRDILDNTLVERLTLMGIDYSTRLACAIFEQQGGNPVVQYIHHIDKQSWKGAFFSPDPEIRMLRELSLLTRTGNLFWFFHRSILEYFLSRAVFDPSGHVDNLEFPPHSDPNSPMAQSHDVRGPLFTHNLLAEPSVIQFLCERVNQHPDFKKQLLAVIEQSKTDPTAATAAANAIAILVRAGVRFNGADLRGIRIPGADLSGSQLDSALLQDADLTDVTFAGSWLRQGI